MRFIVSRTSEDDNYIKPCEEAIGINSKEVVDARHRNYYSVSGKDEAEDWFAYGKNHRVEYDQIKRDITQCDWAIELKTLEDLYNFSKKYGKIVVQALYPLTTAPGTNPSIEIYDYYRE